MQLRNYGSCVVLYFIMCIILIVLKDFHLEETEERKYEVTRFKRFSNRNNTEKNVEIGMDTSKDEFNNGYVDLQMEVPTAYMTDMWFIVQKAYLIKQEVEYFDNKEVDFLSPKTLQKLQHFANDNTTFKFLVVRHPFERLLSSYRDRIEDNSRYTAQAWSYAREILYLSRPELFYSNATHVNVLQRIFFSDKRLMVVPTFQEFVEWLLKQPLSRDDVHWAQYHRQCAVCNISYNFILKLDKYTSEEINYVLSKLRLNRSQIYLSKLGQTRNGVTDFPTTCNYFSNLTANLVLQLYERYKVDFDMYNYKFDEYLRCTK